MPQFDPSTFASQLFWLLVCFSIMFFFFAKMALPKLASMLEQRERVRQDDLERAEALKEEADAAIAAFEAALADAREQGHQALKEAQDDVAATITKRNQEIADEIAERIKTAEAKIATARDEALKSVQEIAADAATDAVAKLAGVNVDGAAVTKAVADVGGKA